MEQDKKTQQNSGLTEKLGLNNSNANMVDFLSQQIASFLKGNYFTGNSFTQKNNVAKNKTSAESNYVPENFTPMNFTPMNYTPANIEITEQQAGFQTGQSQQQEQKTNLLPKNIPADFSSFLDMADVAHRRVLLYLTNKGYKITPQNSNLIYQKIIKKMAQKGYLPYKREVDDRALLLLLARKGEINIPNGANLNDVPSILEKLSPTEKAVFLNKREHYKQLKSSIEKTLYGSNNQIPVAFQIIPFMNQNNSDSNSQVIDLE